MRRSRNVLQLMAVAVPCFIAALVTSAPTLADGLNAPAYHFGNMHQHPWFWDVVGASAIGWVIGIVKGFSGSKEWLDRYWLRAPLLVVWMLDFLVFVVVGGYLGTGIYNPMTFLAALSAGLSWPIGLGALATKD